MFFLLNKILICRGTHGYMAPEVLSKGTMYDSSADWFSFGCMLFKLLKGHSPFRQHKTKDKHEIDRMTLTMVRSIQLYTRLVKSGISFWNMISFFSTLLKRFPLTFSLCQKRFDSYTFKEWGQNGWKWNITFWSAITETLIRKLLKSTSVVKMLWKFTVGGKTVFNYSRSPSNKSQCQLAILCVVNIFLYYELCIIFICKDQTYFPLSFFSFSFILLLEKWNEN